MLSIDKATKTWLKSIEEVSKSFPIDDRSVIDLPYSWEPKHSHHSSV